MYALGETLPAIFSADLNVAMSADPALVTQLQAYLKTWGVPSEDAAGVFGTRTERAVKTLQTKLGVPATGLWDAGTRAALIAELKTNTGKLFVPPPSFFATPEGIAVSVGGALALALGTWWLLRKKSSPALAGSARTTARAKRGKKRRTQKRARQMFRVEPPWEHGQRFTIRDAADRTVAYANDPDTADRIARRLSRES